MRVRVRARVRVRVRVRVRADPRVGVTLTLTRWSGKRSSRKRTMQIASCASRVFDHDLSDSTARLKAIKKGAGLQGPALAP